MYNRDGDPVAQEDVLASDERDWRPEVLLPSMLMTPINLKNWPADE